MLLAEATPTTTRRTAIHLVTWGYLLCSLAALDLLG